MVPFLVLLPLIESDNSELLNGGASSLLEKLGPTALQTVLGLGLLLVGGRVVLRRVFEVVASSRNPEVGSLIFPTVNQPKICENLHSRSLQGDTLTYEF